ncbi:hypothetical protein FS749_002195 [Ceratobasidium sp. UAMH 11750]|nr:hypothetical protein FS749_002195 [Ceratobasidium sp. UAMH 11750]
MLAHCDQHSLFPPSEALTQTQCGRLALQEAGVPHGSSKALAPSMPLENVSPKDARRQTSQFFQRLVRKTFSRSQATPLQAPATPHSPPRDALTIRTRLPARPRTARYSMSFSSAQTEVPPPQKKDDPDPPKKSRWAIVQRFIARPGAAAKAASGANAPAQPAHDRRLSSVSFLGDATTRVDPFARTGGLGATVSDSTALGQIGYSATRAPRRLSMATGVSAYTFERFSHVVSFPSGDGSAASREHTEDSVSEFQTPTTDRMDRGDSVDIVDPDRSGTRYSEDFGEPPDADPKHLSGRPATSREERRHSSPLPVRPPSLK